MTNGTSGSMEQWVEGEGFSGLISLLISDMKQCRRASGMVVTAGCECDCQG